MKAKSDNPLENLARAIGRVAVYQLFQAYNRETDNAKRQRAYYVYHNACWHVG